MLSCQRCLLEFDNDYDECPYCGWPRQGDEEEDIDPNDESGEDMGW
jgi:rRNA maturation endonuclease Nob1